MAAKKPTITRVRIAREELEKMTKEDFQKCWALQEQYIDHLENKLNSGSEHSELMSLRESEEKLKQQQLEATRRENILVMRLTTKEQEMQEYAGQIQELKQAQVPSIAQLRSALLDPAVNLLFERMRKEMDALKARLEETQNELSAWKFTPDSNTGKRLMAKCRLLYQENEELGKMISSGRMAKLEGDLALQKSFSEEMKKSQSELDEFLLELDEDVEGMQSTIYYLQQQLREAKEQILQFQKDKQKLSGVSNGSPANHKLTVPEDSVDTDSQSFPLQSDFDKSKQCSATHSPMSNDLNGTEELYDPVPDKGNNSEQPWSPPPQKNDVKNEAVTVLNETTDLTPQKELATQKEPIVTHESNAQSRITENKNSALNEKQILLTERTNLVVDGLDDSQAAICRTNDHLLDVNKQVEGKPSQETSESISTQNTVSSKRTSEGGRGRKRTRPRTPVETDAIKEGSLPVRKRTRRREAAEIHQETVEEKQTSLEIDTDTEVQVAQTLAYWASAKQERTEVQPDPGGSSVGNGEIIKKEGSDS